MTKVKLILIRHGESQWNKENRFTGWTDVELSDNGRLEAKKAGMILKSNKLFVDCAYTSVLKRAIHTLWIILDELDQSWIPVEKSWRLNERHYGALQGLNKEETINKYGINQVMKWRRDFRTIPPILSKNDERSPKNDIRYAHLNKEQIPASESLSLTLDRVVNYWNNNILSCIRNRKQVLIVAHGNSIRAIRKFVENMNEQEIFELNVPTGIPFVYEFNKEFHIINSYYLE